jgi:hypothetical protein
MSIDGSKYEWKLWVGQDETIKIEIVGEFDDAGPMPMPNLGHTVDASVYAQEETVCHDNLDMENAVALWNAIGLAILQAGGKLEVEDAIRQAVLEDRLSDN